jgi:hypothetical protein
MKSSETVSWQMAVFPLAWAVAVMVAVPRLIALTRPALDTVATFSLLLDHVTALLLALDGSMAALRVSVQVAVRVRLVLLREMVTVGLSSPPEQERKRNDRSRERRVRGAFMG